MTAYVLVGGAGRGGWCWQDAAARLRAQGQPAYPVTLTGLGRLSAGPCNTERCEAGSTPAHGGTLSYHLREWSP